MQMGVGIRQSIADVDTDSLLSQNWPPSPPVRWRSCSETDSSTTEKHGRKKMEKTARNAMEFLISVDLGNIWPPLNKTLYNYSCTFNLYFWSQVLERSMGLHTCAINTIRLDCKLAVSTARDKNVC